jgi:small conductance mechanosensitive channel
MWKYFACVALLTFALANLAHAQPAALAEKMILEQAPAQQSAPTTQPAQSPAQLPTLAQVLSNTRLGKLARGDMRDMSLADLKDPIFWIDTIRDLVVAILTLIPRLLLAVFFLVLFWVFYRAIRRVVLGSMKRAHVDPSIQDMMGYLIKWTVMGFGIVIACNQIGIQIAALLTGFSIVGLAIGFAAQETLANFIAGVVIFWDKPFRVGDWIEIDHTFGQVQRITFRSTRLLDLDGEAVVFPNTFMLANKLSNHTTHPATRISVPIGIAYSQSIEHARRVLLGTITGDERILQDPAASVFVAACADSSVNLVLSFWIADESLAIKIRYEYQEKVKRALDEAGISIPFPHMQLMIEETPALDKLTGASLRKAG